MQVSCGNFDLLLSTTVAEMDFGFPVKENKSQNQQTPPEEKAIYKVQIIIDCTPKDQLAYL